jgi:hypothetical protein
MDKVHGSRGLMVCSKQEKNRKPPPHFSEKWQVALPDYLTKIDLMT